MSSLALGLIVALAASVALNAGYLFQHAGSAKAPAITPRRPWRTLRSLVASRAWLAGLGLGLGGWALHVLALSFAPLSLVQAFVAGGLVLAVPIAVRAFGHRVSRMELGAICLMAGALAVLPLGLSAPSVPLPLPAAPMAAFLAAAGATAGVLALLPSGRHRSHALGAAGGILYGAADLATKALTDVAGHGGLVALLTSPWLGAAVVATSAAFFAFQRGLQTGAVLTVIALMTAAVNIVSIAGGLLVLGEPLGATPVLAGVHLAAFGLVGVAAWMLAPTQAALSAGVPEKPRLAVSAASSGV